MELTCSANGNLSKLSILIMYILSNCKNYKQKSQRILNIDPQFFFIFSNKVTPFRLIQFPLLKQKSWFFQLPLAVVDIVLVLVFHKLHRTLQSTVGDPLGVSEKVTRVPPRKRNVSAQTEMGQDQVHLEPHSRLGPVNPIRHSFVNLQQELCTLEGNLTCITFPT